MHCFAVLVCLRKSLTCLSSLESEYLLVLLHEWFQFLLNFFSHYPYRDGCRTVILKVFSSGGFVLKFIQININECKYSIWKIILVFLAEIFLFHPLWSQECLEIVIFSFNFCIHFDLSCVAKDNKWLDLWGLRKIYLGFSAFVSCAHFKFKYNKYLL